MTLLNREVQTAANRFGYRPYVVRFKIDLVPYARNEPYDAYSDISFFGYADANDPNAYFQGMAQGTRMPQPVVVPLLVSDNLVGTHTATRSDSMRQLGFALTALLANVQANASVQYLADALRSITGTNLNSIETITRHTDNTIRVRLGGALSPDITRHSAYVMEARTYNVTVLLLVPRELDLPGVARSVHVVMQTRLRNSRTGLLIDQYHSDQVDQAFDRIIREDFPDSINGKSYKSYISTMPPATVQQALDDLKNAPNNCPDFARSPYALPKNITTDDTSNILPHGLLGYLFDRVTSNDEHCFMQALIEFKIPLGGYEYIWNDLAVFGSTYGASDATVDLPLWREAAAPPPQVAVVQDDGKSAATTTLVGGSDLVAERIKAYLTTSATVALGAPLYAKSITMLSPSGLQITFPTLGGLCAGKTPQGKNPDASKDKGGTQDVPCGKLTISQYADPWLDAGTAQPTVVIPETDYPIDVRIASNPAPGSAGDAGSPQQAAFTFEVKIKELAANDTHQGTVRVFIAIPTAPLPASQIKSVVIDAQGGEILNAAFVSPSKLSETFSNGTITVAPPPGADSSGGPTPSAIDINLRNLDAGQTLTLAAVAKAADGSRSTITCPIAIKPPTWAVEKAVTTP